MGHAILMSAYQYTYASKKSCPNEQLFLGTILLLLFLNRFKIPDILISINYDPDHT